MCLDTKSHSCLVDITVTAAAAATAAGSDQKETGLMASFTSLTLRGFSYFLCQRRRPISLFSSFWTLQMYQK